MSPARALWLAFAISRSYSPPIFSAFPPPLHFPPWPVAQLLRLGRASDLFSAPPSLRPHRLAFFSRPSLPPSSHTSTPLVACFPSFCSFLLRLAPLPANAQSATTISHTISSPRRFHDVAMELEGMVV
ncbi:hypothetical protein C8J57DRAFT_1711810 [Mycena rebaudengoi]|nr:hypothetical protein C8J57DRAFT_1711810 [Mycena rebaudengoi]